MVKYLISSTTNVVWILCKLFALFIVAPYFLFITIPQMWSSGTFGDILFAAILIGVFGYYLIIAVLNGIIKFCDYLLKPRY